MIELTVKTFCRNVSLVVFNAFGWCLLLPILIIFLVPFYVWKIFAASLARILNPNLTLVSGDDALFVTDNIVQDADIEGGRSIFANIGICIEIEESTVEINRIHFAESLEKTLLQNTSLQEYAWKLKCHLVRFCGYTFRKETSRFSIYNHVKKVDLTAEQDLLKYLNTWITKPYDATDMPPWEFLILKSNSKQYIAYKFHHSICDGLILTQIPAIIFQDPNQDPPTFKITSRNEKRNFHFDTVNCKLYAPFCCTSFTYLWRYIGH